jgi:hypothetical protein
VQPGTPHPLPSSQGASGIHLGLRLFYELKHNHSPCRYSWFDGRWIGFSSGFLDNQSHQDRRELLGKKIEHREALYADFISESARLLADVAEHNFNDPKNLLPSYALLARIRLGSSRQVLVAAEEVIRLIMDAYAKPNLTAEQLQSAAMTAEDPLRDFSDTCRAELESLQGQL